MYYCISNFDEEYEMDIFLHILEHNIFPIFVIIGLGYLVSKKFDLNITTLSKLVFYLFTPAFMTVNLFTADLTISMLKTLLFCILYTVVADLLSRVVAKIRKFDIGMTNAFKNSIMFNNTANIGLSLVTLVFSTGEYLVNGNAPYLSEALSVIIVVMVYTNITVNTLGFFFAGRANLNVKKAIQKVFTIPSIYVIPIVLLLKYIRFDLDSTFLWPAFTYLGNGLVPMALLTLGVQLSKAKFDFKSVNAHISVFTRLILGPILAIVFIYFFRFTGAVAQTVLIAYSVPTAVNTALIAVECDNNTDFATQTVVISTVFSMVTLSFVIYAAKILFPV